MPAFDAANWYTPPPPHFPLVFRAIPLVRTVCLFLEYQGGSSTAARCMLSKDVGDRIRGETQAARPVTHTS